MRARPDRQGESRQMGGPGAGRRRHDRLSFPIAFAGPPLLDLRLSVKCKPVAGKGDQGCGIVWRLKDAGNYYVARANALEDNVHLYRVVDGKRVRFEGHDVKVAS